MFFWAPEVLPRQHEGQLHKTQYLMLKMMLKMITGTQLMMLVVLIMNHSPTDFRKISESDENNIYEPFGVVPPLYIYLNQMKKD